MRFAIGLPNMGPYADPALLVELAHEAERAGWDGVFVWDHLVGRPEHPPATDPTVVLGAIAARTERVKIGAMVTPLSRRRPWKVARETVTLDRLSGGRLIVGVGLGARPHLELEPFGEETDPKRRADALDDGLRWLERLWGGEFEPRPVQQPRPPVWVAGRWPRPRPFRRAARWDGVFPTFVEGDPSPERLAEVVAFVATERGDRDFDAALELHSDGKDRETVAAYERAGLTWWVEALGWWRGDVDENRRRIHRGPPG